MRRRVACAAFLAAGAALAAAPRATSAAEAGTASSPFALVERLAALGPRLPSTPAHDAARELLAESLCELGLIEVGVARMPNGTENVVGLLPGSDPAAGEIVLAAHYDTVVDSPGAADDAAGCAVVLGAVAELQRAPLRRSVRVLFFDGEEAGLLGSEAWVSSLAPAARERVLGVAVLDLIGVDRRGAPVILDYGGATLPPGPTRAPAWLVHAALRAGAATGFGFRVADHRQPLLAQLLTRSASMPWSSDAAAVIDRDVPAVLLSDFSTLHPDDVMHTPDDRPDRVAPARLERWVVAVAALVRRLDALAGRPRWEEEYLAVAGRVWIGRDLIWIGLVLWIALVFRSRPGRWAGARSDERRARGRSYLPGYLFRLAFLLATFWIPSLAAPLLYPLAVLGLVAPRTRRGLAVVGAAAAVPSALWLGLLSYASSRDLVSSIALSPGRTALLLLTPAVFGWYLWSTRVASRGSVPPGQAAPTTTA
jgi:hypothetical protein